MTEIGGNPKMPKVDVDWTKKPTDVSDNAVRLWMAHFANPNSTLCFGGDGATMEITKEARSALNELISCGAAKPIPPMDSWPNREYYGGGETSLRDVLADRPHLNPFKDDVRFVTFRKKEDQQ